MDPITDVEMGTVGAEILESYATAEEAEAAGTSVSRAYPRAGGRLVPRGFSKFVLSTVTSALAAHAIARHHSNDADTTPPPGCGRRCGPADPELPIVQYSAYSGIAHGIRGPITPTTFLGIGKMQPAHAFAHNVRFTQRIRAHIQSTSERVTRSMAAGAKRAGELMESPRVRRTAAGVWHHTRLHPYSTTTHRFNLGVRIHPYRVAAHALGYGHLAFAIP